MVLTVILPIGMNIINIIMPETRTNLVTGSALMLTYVFIIAIISKNVDTKIYNKVQNGLIIVLFIILLGTYMCSNNATYICREDVFKNYYTVSLDILQKAENLEEYNQELKWMFSDNIRYTSKFAKLANGMVSNDYETWDNLDGIWLNQQFYDRYLGMNINMCTKEEYNDIIKTKEFKKMKAYPNKGCVKIINDIVVVKTSDDIYELEENEF